MQTLPAAFVTNQILSHDALNQLLAVIKQNTILTSSDVSVSVSDSGTTLSVTKPAPRVQVWPVTVTEDGGDAGDVNTDCTMTYTVNNLDGGELGTGVTPINHRIAKCEYSAGTLGLAMSDGAGGFKLFVCDEGPVGDQTLMLIPTAYDSETGCYTATSKRVTVLEIGEDEENPV